MAPGPAGRNPPISWVEVKYGHGREMNPKPLKNGCLITWAATDSTEDRCRKSDHPHVCHVFAIQQIPKRNSHAQPRAAIWGLHRKTQEIDQLKTRLARLKRCSSSLMKRNRRAKDLRRAAGVPSDFLKSDFTVLVRALKFILVSRIFVDEGDGLSEIAYVIVVQQIEIIQPHLTFHTECVRNSLGGPGSVGAAPTATQAHGIRRTTVRHQPRSQDR